MMTFTIERPLFSRIRIRFQLLVIVSILLVIYYPIAFGDFSLVDDGEIIDSIRNSSWTLGSLFIPHMQGGVYYRPVLFLTFYFDKFLFNLDPGFMHLENILLHALNALLVFWITRQLTENRKEKASRLPFFTALLFGLHPIATESVCWIAGRTDLLACFFILLSTNCLLLYKKTPGYLNVVFSAFLMSLAFLSKEVALAFLPGAFLIYNWYVPAGKNVPVEKSSHVSRNQSVQTLTLFLIAGCAILSFFVLRHFAVSSNDGRMAATIKSMQINVINTGFVFLQTLSFYIKKIFLPFPLNFTIRDVDPLYELLAVPVIALCFLIISKKNILSAFFLSGIFLMAPAFPVALGQIAWTSFAERYVYLSTAFIIVASSLALSDFLKKFPKFELQRDIFVFIILVIMAGITFHRSTVWRDDLAILRDSVQQNPEFHFIRGVYANALVSHGDFRNARIEYTIASEYNRKKKHLKNGGNNLFQLRYWDLPDLGLASLLVKEHKFPEAITLYEKIVRESRGECLVAVNNLLFLYGGMLSEARNQSAYNLIKKKLSFYGEMLYNKSDGAGYTFYWVAREFLDCGDRREALSYFLKADKKYPADDPYKQISEKFIGRLEK